MWSRFSSVLVYLVPSSYLGVWKESHVLCSVIFTLLTAQPCMLLKGSANSPVKRCSMPSCSRPPSQMSRTAPHSSSAPSESHTLHFWSCAVSTSVIVKTRDYSRFRKALESLSSATPPSVSSPPVLHPASGLASYSSPRTTDLHRFGQSNGLGRRAECVGTDAVLSLGPRARLSCRLRTARRTSD